MSSAPCWKAVSSVAYLEIQFLCDIQAFVSLSSFTCWVCEHQHHVLARRAAELRSHPWNWLEGSIRDSSFWKERWQGCWGNKSSSTELFFFFPYTKIPLWSCIQFAGHSSTMAKEWKGVWEVFWWAPAGLSCGCK